MSHTPTVQARRCDDRLTPEERAVIEAALRLVDHWPYFTRNIRTPAAEACADAVAAYRKATAPPEPFERYMARSHTGYFERTRTYNSVDDVDSSWSQVWRCTVTPTERVR